MFDIAQVLEQLTKQHTGPSSDNSTWTAHASTSSVGGENCVQQGARAVHECTAVFMHSSTEKRSDADLRETFSRFGEVSKVNLIADKFSGESKGFGFVEMDNNSQADAAIKGLNGTDMKGRDIKVNQAKPRAERPSSGPRF